MNGARAASIFAGLVVASVAPRARAGDPNVEYPASTEDTVAHVEWAQHRKGPHMFGEVGFGAMVCPDMLSRFAGATSVLDDTVSYASEGGWAGPIASLRWGVDFGLSPGVDVRLGIGSFLGAAILAYRDPFVAYPHATVQVSVGPGTLYRARFGVVVGALIFELDDERFRPDTAQLGVHGEISPVVLQFGASNNFELSVTQGLGVFVGSASTSSVCDAVSGDGGCVSTAPESDDPAVHLGAHTVLGFGAVLD